MKTFQKFGSILISLIFLISSASPAFAFLDSNQPFPDLLETHPNKGAIDFLKSNNIVHGYPDGNYKPDFTLNRAEFLKILIGTIEESPEGENCFPDVKDEWFAKFVCEAKLRGIVEGYPDGEFKPAQNINFPEAAKIIAHAMDLEVPTPTGNEPWYKGYTQSLENLKAIPVSIDYMEKKLSRGDMSEMIWRLKTENKTKPSKEYAELISETPKIKSCPELKEKFTTYQYSQNRMSFGMARGTQGLLSPMPMMMKTESAADSSNAIQELSAGSNEASSDFSQTNVQVAGVDEGDTVKNDGEYIYLIKQGSVRIVKAFPSENMEEIAEINYDEENKDEPLGMMPMMDTEMMPMPYWHRSFYPEELYVYEDTLIVIGQGENTEVKIYDISDRTSPELIREIEFEGNKVSSRRIGDDIYLVTNQHPYFYGEPELLEIEGEEIVPKFKDSLQGEEMPVVPCGDIRFYPRFTAPNFLTVAGISLNNVETDEVKREVFMGGGDQVYASLENLYVTTTKHEHEEMQQYDIWSPPVRNTSTIILQFSLNDGDVEYTGQGQVPGDVLNQFSMDEYNGNFRIATTKGDVWSSVEKSTNNLYILDAENLENIVGKLEGLAPGEKIYSARFMGDRAYMVTFKKVDPFFAIDVSDPANPKVLGELKIPGYSDYLHPFDENHILGFGKDAIEADPEDVDTRGIDFAWYQGMKIGLFDVTDPTNPIQKFVEVIGDRGTESELLHNHKALLFDKTRELFAFPLSLHEIQEEEPKAEPTSMRIISSPQYGDLVFQGAYVYTLNLDEGFNLEGRITHHEEGAFENGYYYNYDGNIQRIIRIGENLYTISDSSIYANEIEGLAKLNSVELRTDEHEEDRWIYDEF